MFRQRPFLIRCLLACAISSLGLLVVTSLSIATAAPATLTAADRLLAITPTLPLDLAPDNGSFVEVHTTTTKLPGVQYGSAHWANCNNDSASDVLLTGQVSPTLRIARVYRQEAGGVFTLTASFSGVINGAAAWGDYDNDGWLDVAVTGESALGPISQLYHNERNGTACTFSLAAANLIGVRHSTVAWGDYNADGQLDLLLAGDDGSQPVTKIYRNDHGSFTDSGLILPGIQNGTAIWGDYDSDGLADLLLTGTTTGTVPLSKVYRNVGPGTLIDTHAGLPELSDSAAAWGDYDNDGDLDLLLEGKTAANNAVAEVYSNTQGTLVKNNDASNLLGSLDWTSAAWGDYDTDGYLDALISSNDFATAYRNEITGSFASGINVGASRLAFGTAVWGHYDNNHNLDVLLTGQSLSGLVTKIYRYSNLVASIPPDAPRNLAAAIAGSNVTLRWSPPFTDDHTALAGLNYNLRVGTQPGGMDIIAPMANLDTGDRLLPAMGNMYQARAFTLRNLNIGQTYYWSVQAIDTSYLGSSFATEVTFQIPHRVFLPALLKDYDYLSYYTDERETEPNNTYLQANGPLVSGRVYRGLHDDEKDYYSVYLRAPVRLNVDMISLNGATQLQLFYQSTANFIDYAWQPPYHISHTGPPGWYYIYVYTRPDFVGTQTYTLTVTYP